MGIKTKTCEEWTTLQSFGRYVPLFAPIHDVDALTSSVVIDSTAAGTALTLVTTVCPVPCTIAFTIDEVLATSSLTITVVGVNQFNKPVTEIVAFDTVNDTVQQTSNAFMRVTSITLTAKTGTWVAHTLESGFARDSLTNAERTQLGLPFVVKEAGDIVAVSGDDVPGFWIANKAVDVTYNTVASLENHLLGDMAMQMVILSDSAQLKY